MVKRFLRLQLFLLLSLFALYSEETLSMTVSPNPVGVNDNFNIVIEVNHPESREVEWGKNEFPDGIQLRRGPYVRPATVKTKEGVSKRITRITITFRSRRAGRIAFEPMEILVGGETISTPPFLLEVGTYISRQLVQPLEVEWKIPYEFVYTGEAVPLLLQVVRQREIVLFDSITLSPPGGGIFQEYPGVGVISSGITGGTLLYDVPAGFYIFTPTAASRVTIPSAELEYGLSSGSSDRKILQVQALPSEVASTGAVGRFELITRMEQEELHSRDEAVFRVRIEGIGNLNYLQVPVPEFEGAELLSTLENEKFSADMDGFKGYREIAYTIKIGEGERVRVIIPPFPYIERPSGKIIPSRESTFTYTILPAEPYEEDQEAGTEHPELLLTGGTGLPAFLDYRKSLNIVILFFPGPLALILFGLFAGKGGGRGRRERTIFMAVLLCSFPLFFSSSRAETSGNPGDADLSLCREAYGEEDYDAALEALNRSVSGRTPESWMFYSRGLIYSALEKQDLAVISMLKAIEMDPGNSLYREGLVYIHGVADIDNSYPPRLSLDTGYLLLYLVIVVNLLSLLAIFYRSRQGGILSILMVLSAALILVIIVFISAAGISTALPRGVVLTQTTGMADSVFLKKIPRDAGEDWLKINPGTVVRIRDRAEGYLLVEDGDSIRGWLPAGRIYRMGDE